MFWDSKNERYKILFRDGEDAWATSEELDRAIAFKTTYSDLFQLEASYEEWDSHAVQAKLITYGLYCAKHVGPPSSTKASATASLNGRGVFPQRFASDTKSTSSDKTKDLRHRVSCQLVIKRPFLKERNYGPRVILSSSRVTVTLTDHGFLQEMTKMRMKMTIFLNPKRTSTLVHLTAPTSPWSRTVTQTVRKHWPRYHLMTLRPLWRRRL